MSMSPAFGTVALEEVRGQGANGESDILEERQWEDRREKGERTHKNGDNIVP